MYREIEETELKVEKPHGYLYFIDKEHPLASSVGRVYHHRHVASITLGRWLNSEEHVHHINENRADNRPENLEVLSREEHTKRHKGSVQEKICPECTRVFLPSENKIKHCSIQCARESQVKDKNISKEYLQELIDSGIPWTKIGKLIGYSDVGAKKRAKALGCRV